MRPYRGAVHVASRRLAEGASSGLLRVPGKLNGWSLMSNHSLGLRRRSALDSGSTEGAASSHEQGDPPLTGQRHGTSPAANGASESRQGPGSLEAPEPDASGSRTGSATVSGLKPWQVEAMEVQAWAADMARAYEPFNRQLYALVGR